MALKCTNTSGPSSRVMKPYPLSGLNHFTVPVATSCPLLSWPRPDLTTDRWAADPRVGEGTARSQDHEPEPSFPVYPFGTFLGQDDPPGLLVSVDVLPAAGGPRVARCAPRRYRPRRGPVHRVLRHPGPPGRCHPGHRGGVPVSPGRPRPRPPGL